MARAEDTRLVWQSACAPIAHVAAIDDLASLTPEDLVRCALAAGVCYGAAAGRVDVCAGAAVEYGRRLRALGAEDQVLLDLLHELRPAIASVVATVLDHSDASLRVMTRIDATLGVMRQAATTGYYQVEYEARGTWADALEQILADFQQATRRE